MARAVIVTGDKELTAMLRMLEAKTARRLHQTASKTAARLVLDKAKSTLPRRTGAFARSLTVRVLPRSRRGAGYRVTQNVKYASRGRKGQVTTDKDTGYYGVYQELGWVATGRRRRHGGYKAPEDTEAAKVFASKTTETLNKNVTTYRGRTFKIGQLRKAKKMPARWLMRSAGKKAEPQAVALYHDELDKLITEAM